MAHLAYCGFDCEACPVFQARTSQQRAALAARYGRQPEQIHCGGCQSDTVNPGFCSGCILRACARSKGLAHCAACPAYPCPAVRQALPAGTPGRVRLDALRPDAKQGKEE